MGVFDELTVLQNIEYEALTVIKDICDMNHLMFYLRGGSLLGAVLHKDFVPWDDDIDILIPRRDYQCLIEIFPYYFSEKFKLVCYQKVENAHCYFPRVLLREKYRKELGLPKNNERGLVLIDILPLDGMPNGTIRLKWHIIKAYAYRILASLWTLDAKDTVCMHDKKKQRFLKFLYALKIHHLYKQDNIYRKLDKMYAKYPYGKTKMAGTLSGSKLSKEIVPTEWYGKIGAVGKFRDLDVLIPQNYDAYLKQLFGENYATKYMSVEKRTKSHIKGMSCVDDVTNF